LSREILRLFLNSERLTQRAQMKWEVKGKTEFEI
jgi:hypothetical protein